MLIGIVSFAGPPSSFYLVAYLIMTLLSFAVLIVVANQTGDEIADFDGSRKRSPFLAFAMLIAMISLAGVPFTAGFLGKFFIFDAAIRHHQITLVVVGVITVGLRLLLLSQSRARHVLAAEPENAEHNSVSGLSRVAMSALIGRDHLAWRLSAADLECADATTACIRTRQPTGAAQSLSSTFQ